jgi:hypothetical protein
MKGKIHGLVNIEKFLKGFILNIYKRLFNVDFFLRIHMQESGFNIHEYSVIDASIGEAFK